MILYFQMKLSKLKTNKHEYGPGVGGRVAEWS